MKIVRPSELEIEKKCIRGMIYGQPGTAKSTIACTAPKPVMIDFDNGLMRVDMRYQVDSIPASTYQDLLELFDSPLLNNYETVIIDTLGKMVDAMGDYLCELNPKYRQADGALTIKGWGAIKSQFQVFLKKAIIAQKHLIFVAHQKEEKDGDGIIVRPDVSGSSGKDIVKELDFLGYIEMKGNKRAISFSPDQRYHAKNSIELNDLIMLPSVDNMSNFLCHTVFDSYVIKAKEKAKLMVEYNKVVDKYSKMINEATTVNKLNKAYEACKEAPEVFSTKIVLKELVMKTAKALNAVYNKDTGKFEKAEEKDA